MLNAELSPADKECLEEFVRMRLFLAADLGYSSRDEDALIHYQSDEVEELSTHELLIAEVITLATMFTDLLSLIFSVLCVCVGRRSDDIGRRAIC
jgi:hypothetical protein